MNLRPLFVALLCAACSGYEPYSPYGEGGGSGHSGSQPAWVIGDWSSPEYVNGTGPDRPTMRFHFNSDGTYQHYSGSFADKNGTFTATASGVLTIDGHSTARMKGCTAFAFEASGFPYATYVPDAAPSGCPDSASALSAAEKCLVGVFKETRSYSSSGDEEFTTIRTSSRLQVFDELYSDAHYVEIQAWALSGDQLCLTAAGGQPTCANVDWAQVESSRTSTKDPGCV